MPSTFIWIAVFALSAALINILGILTVFKHKELAKRFLNHFMCLAAGLMVSVPLILTLPSAIKKNFYAGAAGLAGFLFMFFSNKIIKSRTEKEGLAFGLTAVEGIGFHSLVDGIVYTVTFSVSIFTGVLATAGLVIHEFAEGVITYLVLLKGGVKERKAMHYAFFAAALTTPIGAFIAYPFISKLSDANLGLMLGFVSGVLLYVSASHLLPEADKYEKKHSTLAFLAGIFLALFIVLSELLLI